MAPKKKPTIDDRLEALTQTVELIAQMQLQLEHSIERFVMIGQALIERHDKRLTKLEKRS